MWSRIRSRAALAAGVMALTVIAACGGDGGNGGPTGNTGTIVVAVNPGTLTLQQGDAIAAYESERERVGPDTSAL